MRRLVTALLILLLLPAVARVAGPDNVVDWSGVSHLAIQDRRPICPIAGESFQVRFQALHDDLTGARVRIDTGAIILVDAGKIGTRGPYDIWAAQVPATASSTERYMFELTDGTDVDWLSLNGLSDNLPADGGFALDFTTLSHAPIGATLTNSGTVFKVWAPTRSTAFVRGTFNGWGTGNPLTKVGEYFIGRVNSAGDNAYYKYFFNGTVWNTDPRARALDAGNNYNARVENPFRYSWINTTFQTPPLETMVIYQLHVGTFSGRNDPFGTAPHPARFVDVATRASHLVNLGVNAVLLMPVTEFPTDISAGYNPITQWSPEWKYGTPDEFKYMVDVLHQNGIAVLLDIVWNHFSPTDNYLWNYDGTQTYFDTPAVDTPWGSQADFDRQAVRDYFTDSALHWLEEYRIDGFRMDATGYMDQGQPTSGYSLMQKFNDAIDSRWADKVTIAEELPDDAYITRPTSLGGAGFDSQYYDAFTDQLRQEVLDAAYGSAEMWRIAAIVNGGGSYLSGRSVTNYFELHDEIWPSNGGQRMVKTIDPTAPHDDIYARGRVTLAQGLVMLAPGVPAMHQGTEWLEDTDFGPDQANRIDWSKKITYAGVYNYFKSLIHLRTAQPALRADAGRTVFHLNESQDVVAFDRTDGGDGVFTIIANFGNSARLNYRLGLSRAGKWDEVLNNQNPAFGGSGPVNSDPILSESISADGRPRSAALDLPAMGLVVLKWDSATTGVPEAPDPRGWSGPIRQLAPNPAQRSTTVRFSLARDGQARVEVLDLLGRLVAVALDRPLTAGEHEVSWRGEGEGGAAVAAGIYVIRVTTPEGVATRKLTWLR